MKNNRVFHLFPLFFRTSFTILFSTLLIKQSVRYGCIDFNRDIDKSSISMSYSFSSIHKSLFSKHQAFTAAQQKNTFELNPIPVNEQQQLAGRLSDFLQCRLMIIHPRTIFYPVLLHVKYVLKHISI